MPVAVVERLQAIDDLSSTELKKYISKSARVLCDSVEGLLALNECLHYSGNPELSKKLNQQAINSLNQHKDKMMSLIEEAKEASRNP